MVQYPAPYTNLSADPSASAVIVDWLRANVIAFGPSVPPIRGHEANQRDSPLIDSDTDAVRTSSGSIWSHGPSLRCGKKRLNGDGHG